MESLPHWPNAGQHIIGSKPKSFEGLDAETTRGKSRVSIQFAQADMTLRPAEAMIEPSTAVLRRGDADSGMVAC